MTAHTHLFNDEKKNNENHNKRIWMVYKNGTTTTTKTTLTSNETNIYRKINLITFTNLLQ